MRLTPVQDRRSGTSADVPDVPSPTSMGKTRVSAIVAEFQKLGFLGVNADALNVFMQIVIQSFMIYFKFMQTRFSWLLLLGFLIFLSPRLLSLV